MDNKIEIRNLIEIKRAELYKLVSDKDKIDNKVLKKSQELDLLLNLFNSDSEARKTQ